MNKDKTKVLLCGEYRFNAGPSNVNRDIIENADGKIAHIKSRNRFLKIIEMLWKALSHDVIVFSAAAGYFYFLKPIIQVMNKKSVYLMHGCIEYENDVNQLDVDDKVLEFEKIILNETDLILCVSENYMKWVQSRYPELKNKTYFLNSAIDLNMYNSRHLNEKNIKRTANIIVTGGDRPQKNNLQICEAAEIVSEKSLKQVELSVYGRCYHDNKVFSKFPHTRYKGMVSQEDLYCAMRNSDVFVLNSLVESFGLSVVDALANGCSILITESAGITSLLNLQECDIIYDPNNSNEIAEKLIHIVQHPNNSRIMDSINSNYSSWKKVAERLYKICDCLISGEDYTEIR